ncbi:poly(A) polymerase/tRNA nucleotidyltransferase (CCA-adding enzyme) [Humitalea rosea]|uniref:Poly(A) polymerase/tRNA nucleotidyltransferase (CCA-adding enzyme) n=1 Tax=Humitalea rosea TaxID=990373 RepID=A0A2W7JX22_9PROT|nr:CCA tRNA nucleotidyltransferase [Humitalea rosea]PZW40020.1 poly(A) polymerase/tRNA nucleotidyltransferase (CCA-adding enzyme) [Humitalea rosea]
MSGDPPSTRIAPPAALASGAAGAVLAALPGARAVGGLVRDLLAGRPLADIDVAAPFPPETIAERLRAAGLRVFETGLAHGTVTAVLDREPVEVTALRQDIATDGRHAEVAWTTDWRIDAARRDFTINAMSLAADGRLWDYFGGRADLAAGRVRFVGDPATRLAEDFLRALRFFRFQARYGRGTPDPAAIAAIAAAVPGLARLSAERVWSELKRLLIAPDPCDALALMAACGVLGAVLPEVTEANTIPRLPRLRRLVAITPSTDPVLRLAALLGEVLPRGLGGLAGRLRMSGEERGRLSRYCGHRHDPRPDPGLDHDAARRLLALYGAAEAQAELLLAEAEDGQDRAADRALLAATPVPVFPLLGQDVLDLGVPEGPRIGRLYNSVRGWWFAGGCVADKDALLARMREEVAAG